MVYNNNIRKFSYGRRIDTPERKTQFDLTKIGGDRILTIFNRRELTIAFDMKRQAEVRDLLAQNGIDYSVSVINRKSPSPFSAGSRASVGTFEENLQLQYEYIFYVRKSDYSRASEIISGKKIW